MDFPPLANARGVFYCAEGDVAVPLFSKKPRPCRALLQLYASPDGSLGVVPAVPVKGKGPLFSLPDCTLLPPPCTEAEVGDAILQVWDRWKDAPPLDAPPDRHFWTAFPHCRSYRSFFLRHRLVEVSFDTSGGIRLTYLFRSIRGTYYGGEPGAVELCASLRDGQARLPASLGRAALQILAAAAVLEPNPLTNSDS